MKTTHTPAPWWIDDDAIIASGTGDDYIAIAQGLTTSYDSGDNEITANLTLIAAAPDLLKALEYLYRESAANGMLDVEPAMQQSAAAIAKATSRQCVGSLTGKDDR